MFKLLVRWLRRRPPLPRDLRPPVPAPESAETHFNLGNANYETGNHAEAIASYQRALALRPDLAVAYINLGNVLNDLHRGEEAVASYRSALVLRPGFADGHFNLGNALDDLGRHEEAVASYQQRAGAQARLRRGA